MIIIKTYLFLIKHGFKGKQHVSSWSKNKTTQKPYMVIKNLIRIINKKNMRWCMHLNGKLILWKVQNLNDLNLIKIKHVKFYSPFVNK